MQIWTTKRQGPWAQHMFGTPSARRVVILKTAAVGKTELASNLLSNDQLGIEPCPADAMIVADASRQR